ncbi:hypothetical protein BaRGS_00039332 [Batillaria attramentaria]|uniref:Uncharacterized protein n=1 Tax=Batillaria attramentaria TaxID=370345 RepID=A0ABD0J3A0_9CAEN
MLIRTRRCSSAERLGTEACIQLALWPNGVPQETRSELYPRACLCAWTGNHLGQGCYTHSVHSFLPGYHANNIQALSPGFQAKDRKFSAPVFRSTEDHPSLEEHRLSRTAEVENIPGIVEEERMEAEHHNNIGSLTRKRHYSTPSKNPAADVSSSSIGFPSNISSLSAGMDGEEETKKRSKRRPSDTGYYVVKELLMTERTYKKDLEVLVKWFRGAVSGDPEMLNSMIELIFSRLDPIYEFHCTLVKEIDQRLSSWEGRSSSQANGDWQRIGDVLLQAVDTVAEVLWKTFPEGMVVCDPCQPLPCYIQHSAVSADSPASVLGSFGFVLYRNYFNSQEDIVLALDQRVRGNKSFEELYKEFESQKVCYLPLNTFFLKPGQRLLHYRLIVERLVKHYPLNHPDAADCAAALKKLKDLTDTYKDKLHRLENLQKLMELQRDLIGLENLVSVDREFLREGCLQKYSRKGYQQRMFFLFSDMLVYTSRAASSLLQFKVHGQLPLRGMTIEETEQSKVAVPNTFAIYGGSRCILVAASSQEEKNKWIEDINQAVQTATLRPDTERPQYPSLKSSTSSTENIDGAGGDNDRMSEKPIQHRANTTMHVCWHRNTSVSIYDHERALKNQLSGYLLRKFKTSNGWQKLWVVFTNFCLFFYKTYQDDFPLASLPLLGYAVNQPEPEDGISKDHVFKLQFKNHVYFFRAESEYTYARWMEVINSATSSARRTRLFSRMTSQFDS